MNSKGKYGKYLQAVELLVGFCIVNISYLLACLNDADIIGFRWKVTWLMVNFSYLPVVIVTQRYPLERSMHIDRIAGKALKAVGMHALIFFAVMAFLDSWVHNASFYLWFYSLFLVLLPLGWIGTRLAVKFYRRSGRNYSCAVIVGTNPTAIRLHDEMLSDPGYGYKFMGYFANHPDPRLAASPDYKGPICNLATFIQDHEVREIYYTISGEDAPTMNSVIKLADDNVIQFYYVPQINAYVNRRTELSNIGPLSLLNLRPTPLQSIVNRLLKRGFDVMFSSVALLFSPLIFIPVAIAIKVTSPGPVFFRQKRTGYLGREFDCLKFRTMRVNKDSDKVQANRGDSRITPLGKFLRHTSIDELPQFINVWLGDMSIVGPRPHMLKHTDDYKSIIDKYMVRHFIKPGITGWAQIRGFRGQTEELWQMEKRVECDIWYIEHWTFLLDIKIIVMTVVNAIRGEENAF